jgi:hypothetical protein
VSTQNHATTASPRSRGDAAEQVARVIESKRATLLHVHRHRLRHHDLEECFAQAALELVAASRRGATFANRVHIARTFEQRFLSRVDDRRRALEGRSAAQAELERAMGAGLFENRGLLASDPRADVERLAALRLEISQLPRIARSLSEDQRLVLASQTALQMDSTEFCALFGWSAEKYRKVAQRGRARLRELAGL